MLDHYSPATKQVVIVVYPEDDCHSFEPSRHGGLADSFILSGSSFLTFLRSTYLAGTAAWRTMSS